MLHSTHLQRHVVAPQPRAARRAKPNCRSRTRVTAVSAELEQIDPRTGQAISKGSALSPVAGFQVNAGGLKWAYRRNEVEGVAKDGGADVLLLHGLASSSYSYRNTLGLLGGDGLSAIAPDWIGHGDSEKPDARQFAYTEAAYLSALSAFVDKAGLTKPFALVVQGFILGQYGLLWAAEHPDLVSRMVILNTPVGLKTKLRPELAAYKSPLPFMRPGNKPFDGQTYNMMGSPYAFERRDAEAYGRPYREETAAASAAVAQTMEQVDFDKLLRKVDDAYRSWRKPTILLFGANDPFVDLQTAFEFLESKRTNMKVVTPSAKLGHMPQEDYAEAMHGILERFLKGEADDWDAGKLMKMTKQGAVTL